MARLGQWSLGLLIGVLLIVCKGEDLMMNEEPVEPENLELVFLIHTSPKINKTNFQHYLNFMKDVIEKTNIESGKVKVAAVTYRKNGKIAFNFNKFKTKDTLLKGLGKIKAAKSKFGNLASGLNITKTKLFGQKKLPANTMRWVIILTDANSGLEQDQIAAMAQQLISAGVMIRAYGIGLRDLSQLQLATADVQGLKTYSELRNATKDVVRMLDTFQQKDQPKGLFTPGLADVAIVYHLSNAAKPNEINSFKSFLKSILEKASIDNGQVRVALMNYAKKGRNLVDFSKSKTKAELFAAIDKIDAKYRAAASNAGAALNEVQNKFFTKKLDRPDAENIIILITDAKNSDQPELMVKEADELRKSGFKIITVGIKGADANDLKGVASQSSYSLYSPSFESAITAGFTESVWRVLDPAASVPGVPGTPPTRAPIGTSPSRVVTTKVTQESVPGVTVDTGSEADIVFAVHFNPKRSYPEFLQLIDYLKSLVLTSDVDNQKVRFGLYFDNNNIVFQLKDHTSTNAIIDALGTASKSLTTVDQFDLGSVLRDVRTKMFTPANGDRANVQNILIVFTDTVTSGAPQLLQRERTMLARNKFIVYSAGIGLNDKAALESISSNENNLVTFSGYSELKSYGYQLRQLIPALQAFQPPPTVAQPKKTVPPPRPGQGKQNLEETEENEIDTYSTLEETVENNRNILTTASASTEKSIGCAGAKLDLVFVLDASTSVTEPNFELMKDFVKDFLLDADIDGGNVRVGVVIYSDADYVQFQLNTYAKKADVYNAIDDIPYRYGSTNTADALKTMRSVMFTAGNGDRPDVTNVAVVVTDGVSNINSRRTVPEAEQARAEGIHIYAIGIGLTDTKELDGIASKPVDENRFAVQDFTELRDLRHKVFSALCAVQPTEEVKATTKPRLNQNKTRVFENENSLTYDEADETIDYQNKNYPTGTSTDQTKTNISEKETPSTYDETDETFDFQNKNNPALEYYETDETIDFPNKNNPNQRPIANQKKTKVSENEALSTYDETDETLDYPNKNNQTTKLIADQKKNQVSENEAPSMYDETDETIDYPNKNNPTRTPNDKKKTQISENETPSTYEETDETIDFPNKSNLNRQHSGIYLIKMYNYILINFSLLMNQKNMCHCSLCDFA